MQMWSGNNEEKNWSRSMKSEAKYRAISLMDRMFNIPEGYSSGLTKMFVESIIEAAVAEMKASTELSSADDLREVTKKIEEVQG